MSKMFVAKPPRKKGSVITSMGELTKATPQQAVTRGTVTGGYPLNVRGGGSSGGTMKKGSKRKSKPMY